MRSPPAMPPVLTGLDRGPLVGRRDALDRLWGVWQRVTAGEPAIVAIAGEAGAGKTRLISALALDARERGAAVLAGRCFEDAVAPYGAFTEVLHQHSSWLDPPSDWVAAELGRLVQELASGAVPVAGDPHDARRRLFEAVAVALSDAASHAPVVLVIEDLHWADQATRLMLAHVTRTVASVPLPIIGSFRVEDREMRATLDSLLDDLRRSGRLDELVLDGLSPGEVGELVSARLGSRAPPALGELLHRRTGGNPFFVEEAVRHLREAQPAPRPSSSFRRRAAGSRTR